MRRHRQAIVWLCMAASLLLGVQAQLHGLSHSLQAVQTAAHNDTSLPQTQVCDECLLYTAFDAPWPSSAALPAIASAAASPSATVALPLLTAAFTAYLSRAPPQPV